MKTFQWSTEFETGLATIDDEHPQLVALINRLGASFLAGDATGEASLEGVFTELSADAKTHFAHEEQLMLKARLAPACIARHCKVHLAFVEQLEVLWSSRGSMREPGEVLLGFLVEWLDFHILREDQAMTAQVSITSSSTTTPTDTRRATTA